MSDVRYSRSARMLDDPDLGGDLLLVGLGFVRYLDFDRSPGKVPSTTRIAAEVFATDRRPHYRLKRAIENDARTYQPPFPSYGEGNRCSAPMVRRPGTCGRGTSTKGYITDWETGEMTWIEACARHRDWFWATTRANRAAKPDKPALPAANHGGVLARHIPEFNWPRIWAWATDGQWIQHPERNPWKPPTLTLHLGDADTAEASPRPMLGLVSS